MESEPLGLRLHVVGQGEVFADLSEDCEIVRAGNRAGPRDLRVGMRVELELAGNVVTYLRMLA